MAEHTKVPEPEKTVQRVYHKIPGEKGEGQIVLINLPTIDAYHAVKSSPHMYAFKHDAFAKEAPKVELSKIPEGVVGPSGGKPAKQGGIGVVGLVGKDGELISGP